MSLINVPGAASRFLEKKVGRFTLCAGLAAGMVAALSLGTANVASAATVPAVHQPAKGGGFGWGGPRSRRGHGFGRGAIGTVASLPLSTTAPTSFTITTGSSSSPTTVTVDVSTTTTFKDPGVSSPGLANLAVGDKVQVVGTQAGTGTVDATSVGLGSSAGGPWGGGGFGGGFGGGGRHHHGGR